jgi:hypothetical protein
MNITLSIEDQVVKRAREKAAALGKSLNQLVRDYLEQFAGRHDPDRVVRELRRLSAASGGHSRGKRWTREELHDRS